MSNARKEESFKLLLEKLIENGEKYDNIFKFIEGEGEGINSVDEEEFIEELSIYNDNIKEIFKVEVFTEFDIETYNYKLDDKVLNNVKRSLTLIKNLTPSEFEKLCALYFQFLGCTDISGTKTSHDEGIDFVGVIESRGDYKLFAKGISPFKTYLIGQAKHYQRSTVNVGEIRELAGSLYLLKNKNFSLSKEPYMSITQNIKAFTVIQPYFITSNYFSQYAKELCEHAGIIQVDRILLSFTFALYDKYLNDEGNFDENKLRSTIEGVRCIG